MSLRILLVHNTYRMAGGEDSVVATETELLRAYGHEVKEYKESNDAAWGIRDIRRILYPWDTAPALKATIAEFKPHIAHFHNVYYRITPAAYWTCYRAGVPVIQTLHNYRYGCINARLSRNGVPCERCLISFSRVPGVAKRCFQNSAIKSMGLALNNQIHSIVGSFSVPVSRYIALSEFARSKHILAGLPAEKLTVKANCVYPDPGVKTACGDYCLFVGRLEMDKGVRVLLEAAARSPGIPFVIAGEGPLEAEVRRAGLNNLRYLGQVPRAKILALMKGARLLVFPSLAYENFPMTIAEAFAVGLPVVACRRGTAGEVVQNLVNGIHTAAGDSADLAAQIRAVWRDKALLTLMSIGARSSYETRYSGECTIRALTAIYEQTVAEVNRADAGQCSPARTI